MDPRCLSPDAHAPFALFDDNLGAGGDLLLHDFLGEIQCTDPSQIEATFRRIREASAEGKWVVVAAHYELGLALEPRLHPRLPSPPRPLLTAWVFSQAHRQTDALTTQQLNTLAQALGPTGAWAGLGDQRLERDEVSHGQAVEQIRRLIAAGDCYQVNLTLGLRGELWGHPLALYRRLRSAQPVRYGACIRHPGGHILSRSPELFVERQGDRLICKPMKGTAPGDRDPADLIESAKDRAENVMIVDLIRNDLGRLAPPGGVQVEQLFEAEAYPSLWQLTSTVSAQPVTADLETVFRALFPCGSVTGAPKIRAMEIIHNLEPHPRGLYCGALGWVAPNGDFRFSVPIRTLELDTRGQGRMGIGSGIVFDSTPSLEWQECLLKARFLAGLETPLQLIETLRREPDPGAPYPLLAAHLERLAASAAWFGFGWEPGLALAALHRVQPSPDGQPLRVRLTLAQDGQVGITVAPLDPLPADPSIVVSPIRLASGDPLLRHKTTARQLYDQVLQRVTADGHFDALFLNERDELCEGARSNLFLRIDGALLTPAATSGLLNGVLRRSLVARGEAREARLTLADLARAEAVFMGNGLRGLVPVRVVG